MTFAILNCIGTTPVEKDNLKMWKRGSMKADTVCLIKLVEMPVKSGVFLVAVLQIQTLLGRDGLVVAVLQIQTL